jgi:threonine dehydrogenase-like Zn-dependent dehydrogenase
MKALTVKPKVQNTMSLRDLPEPTLLTGELLCDLVAVGICGTDVDISKGLYGTAPADSEYLIIGHESLGRVIKAPPKSEFKTGDLVVGIVRRPDPIPCANCAVGEWDMCQNGLYQERGIKGLHGFASERFSIEEKYALKIDEHLGIAGVLLEPASVVAKAWQQSVFLKSRSKVKPTKALITGAGPVGLLAAMMGMQYGLEVHVFDRNTDGPKGLAVKNLGATYYSEYDQIKKSNLSFDITIECTGVSEVILNLIESLKPDGVLCLAGISNGGVKFPVDVGALNLNIVLQNEIIFGSVNANRQHYTQAAAALAKADLNWLNALITRKVPFKDWQSGFVKEKLDIKNILIPSAK